jgi:predicted RNA binding protein with dsRBD fold (UPF0201 family)
MKWFCIYSVEITKQKSAAFHDRMSVANDNDGPISKNSVQICNVESRQIWDYLPPQLGVINLTHNAEFETILRSPH